MKVKILKKTLSVFLAFIMMFSLMCPAFSVWAAEDYSDYVPGAMPEDLISDGWIYGDTNDSKISFGWANGYGTDVRYYASSDVSYTATSANWSVGGALIKGANINGGAPLSSNTTYVFSAKFKNAGTEGTAPKFGVYYSSNKGRIFPNEYGSEGWTPGSEFTDYNITFSTGESTSGTFVYGLVSAKAGDEVHMNYKNGMYLAVEESYDITNTVVGDSIVGAGESVSVKTEVVNQLGQKGTRLQNFTYKVLDEERTKEVDGFTVTEGEGTATIAVDPSVPTGNYVILAISDDYDGFRKGANISVIGSDAYTDYIPGEMPANLFTKPYTYSYVAQNNSNVSSAWFSEATAERYLTAKNDFEVTSSDTWAVNGLAYGNYSVESPFAENTNYVFSTTLKTASGTPRVSIVLQRGSGASSFKSYPIETSSNGYTPDTQYEVYKATFATDETGGGTLWFGMLKANSGDSIIQNFKAGSYLAAEEVYDITVDFTGSSMVFPGGTTTVKAEAVNQIYTKGTLRQNFKWTALNYERDSEAEGITITPNQDGTASVRVADTVPAGKYIIFAASQDYKKLRKGVAITVEQDSAFADYVPADKPANLLARPYTWSYTNSNTDAIDSVWLSGSSTERKYTANKDFTLTQSSTWAVNGFSLGNYTTAASPFEANTSYVYSTHIKTLSGAPRFNIAYQINTTAHKNYPVECGSEGYTPGADYEEFKATFNTGETGGGLLWVGLSSASKGDEFMQNFSKATYLAKEQAYDITVAPASDVPEDLKGGDSVSFEAGVLNQIGVQGTTLQNFEWFALKDGKTAVTSDIRFSVDADTSRAVATLDNNIENGTYYILAKSKDYKGFVKSYEIVVGAQGEYVPGDKPQNMVKAPANVNIYESSNGAVTSKHSLKNNEYYSWKANKAPNTYWKVGHTYLTVTDSHLTQGFTAGKNYIISAGLKNDAMSVNPAALFGVALGFDRVASVPVTSADYATYTTVVTAPSDCSTISIGFDGSVDRSTLASPEIITIDLSNGGSLYVAEEIAYDVNTCLTSENTILTKGDSISATAELVNQLGIQGKLEQNFVWSILDSNKTNFGTGFTLDVSDDTTSVTVTAGSKAPYGTYYLAVHPASDSSMVKLIKFRLKHDVQRFYVSPDGDDKNNGTLSAPFKTLIRAKDAVRELGNKDMYIGIEVVLRGGEYRLSETLELAQIDSGTSETPVVYTAYEGETPVIKGSVVLDTSKIRGALSSDIVPRLHPDAEGKVKVIDLREQGLTSDDVFDMSYQIASFYNLRDRYELNTIFTDGVMQTLSQWPNDRAYSVRGKSIVDEIIQDSNGKDVKISTSFNYTEDEPDRWAQAKGWYIGAFMPYDYSYARLGVKSIDTENKVLAIYGREGYATDFSFTDNFSKRWKAFNLLEEIDLPGEYCIDSENMLLYYYPPYAMDDAKLEIATMFDNLVDITGASDITLRGISFAQTNGIAISMRNVENIDVEYCNFDSIGGTAINVVGTVQAQTNKDYWQQQIIDASYNCDVRNCVFTNLAGVAISMGGGNVDTLTKSGNIIENNFIYDFGNKHLASASGAISISGCGTTVRNNNISLSPGIAILLHGNDHLIEYNEIYDVMREVADAGAIYQGRNALARGSIIRYNYIHDLRPVFGLAHSAQVGIYLDDCQHDLAIENNIIKNVTIDFNSNGAGAFTFSGNTSIDVDKAWNFLNHASTNTSTVTKGPGGTLEFIESQIYDKELYFERYPELKEFLNVDRVPGNNPKYFTVAKDNIAVNVGGTNIQSENLAYSTLENNEVVSGPENSIFVDPLNGDYRIKATSPYAKSTRLTESFDIDTIGIQTKFTIGNYGSFDTIYPKAGDTVSNKNGVTFVWNIAPGATEYVLTVATDKNFENIVHTESTRLNTAVVNTLNSDTAYYWKVEARNTSRDLADIWACANGVSHFTVRDYEATISSVTMDTYDTLSLVNAKVTNSSSDTTEFDVVFAAYGDGKLVASQRIPQTIPQGQSININTGFDTEGKYIIEEIKIFVWGKGSLVPYARARVLK